MMLKKDLKLIEKIFHSRFKKTFCKAMTAVQKQELRDRVIKHFNEGQFVYQLNPLGTLDYFILSHCSIMPEFNEQFFYVPEAWCTDDALIRKKFYGHIRKLAHQAKLDRGVQRMIMTVSVDDRASLNYFSKKGKLTYIELHGDTKKSLAVLKRDKNLPSGVNFSQLKAMDIPALVKLDIESHLKDPTSRMREIFAKPSGKKLMKGFYRNLLKNKTCLVARKDNRLAGSIAWFLDRKNGNGLVASIFVTEKFKGNGISKLLYMKMLQEFEKKKLGHYIGSSTTGRVLGLARKMKRSSGNHAFLLSI